MIQGDFFVPEADIIEVLADGRHIFREPKGKRIPLHIARAKGYVKDALPVGPSEVKAEEPAKPARRARKRKA
jgi:hypothetical protein